MRFSDPLFARCFDEGVKAWDAKPGGKAPASPYSRGSAESEAWLQGWNWRLGGARVALERYIKARRLFDKQYLPPGWPSSRLVQVQTLREKAMKAIVEEFPAIPAAYEKHLNSF